MDSRSRCCWKCSNSCGCSIAKDSCRAEGMIKNFNTLEEFKKADRSGMLKRTAATVINPSKTLSLCVLISATDMGCHPRRLDLLLSLTSLVAPHPLICRPQEIQIPPLVRIPGLCFYAHVVYGWSYCTLGCSTNISAR